MGDYSQLTGWFVENKHYNTSYRMVSMAMAHWTTFCHIETSRIKSWSYTVRVRSCHWTTHCLGFRRCRANPKNGWRARVCRLTSLRRLSLIVNSNACLWLNHLFKGPRKNCQTPILPPPYLGRIGWLLDLGVGLVIVLTYLRECLPLFMGSDSLNPYFWDGN